VAHCALGRPEDAVGYFQRSLEISLELDARWGQAYILRHLGEVYDDLRRFEEAIDCYRRSSAISREVGSRRGLARALDLLGVALRRTQGAEAAREYWQEALDIFTQIEAPEAEQVRARLAESAVRESAGYGPVSE
jgi:tetratricopeptide (TPR) repeat protein